MRLSTNPLIYLSSVALLERVQDSREKLAALEVAASADRRLHGILRAAGRELYVLELIVMSEVEAEVLP